MNLLSKGKSLPEGTRSPDGKKIKRQGDWVYDRKTSKVYLQDIKENHTYFIGKNVKATVNKIINDLVYYSHYYQAHHDDPYTVEHSVESLKNFHDKVSQFTIARIPIKKYNPSHFKDVEQYKAFTEFINSKNPSLPVSIHGKRVNIDFNELPKVAQDEIKRKFKANQIDYTKSQATKESYDFFKNLLNQKDLDTFAEQSFDYNKSVKDNIETMRSFGLSNQQISDSMSNQYFEGLETSKKISFSDDNIKKEIFINKDVLNQNFGIKNSKKYNRLKNLDTIINLKNEKAKSFNSIPLLNGLYGHYGDYIKVQRWDIDASSTKKLIEDEGRLIANKQSDKFGEGWVFKRKDGKTFNIWKKFWNPSINFIEFSNDKSNDQIF